jgi:hypothetical protein
MIFNGFGHKQFRVQRDVEQLPAARALEMGMGLMHKVIS